MRAKLEQALDTVARPGWRVAESVRGVPPEWLLITDVEIVALGEFGAADDRNALVPTAWSQMTLHGGFRLPGRARWLASAPPEISVSALEGGKVDVSAAVELRPADDDAEGPPATVLRRSVADVATIDLDEYVLDPGRYYLTATRHDGAEVIARVRVDLIEPCPSAFNVDIGHAPGHGPLWPVTAQPGGRLRGAALPAGLEAPDLGSAVVELTVEVPAAQDEEESEDDVGEDVGELPIDAPQCFRTGYHHFSLGPDSRKGHLTACSHCAMEKFIPPKPPRKARGGVRTVALPPLPAPSSPHEDQALLALSAVGSGSRASLERIIDQVDDAPWALDERARALSSLGHLDLTFDREGRIDGWAVAPPVLACVSAAEAIVCGWRSEQLVYELGRLAAQLGGTLAVEANGDAPDRVAISGLGADQLADLSDCAGARLGADVTVAQQPGRTLAFALPAVADLVAALPAALSPDRLEWLRPGAWAWEPCGKVGPIGAYRTRGLPRRTFFHDGSTLRACEPRLARWLAIPPSTPHIAYDPASGTLTVPLGGRLPALWERAVVLTSGRAPQKVGGRLAYRDVPSDVALRVAATLSTTTEAIAVA
jgi:hypothetical protein